jgi:hypothetical protein
LGQFLTEAFIGMAYTFSLMFPGKALLYCRFTPCSQLSGLIFLCKVSKVGRTQSTALLFGKIFIAAFHKSQIWVFHKILPNDFAYLPDDLAPFLARKI